MIEIVKLLKVLPQSNLELVPHKRRAISLHMKMLLCILPIGPTGGERASGVLQGQNWREKCVLKLFYLEN